MMEVTDSEMMVVVGITLFVGFAFGYAMGLVSKWATKA